MNHTLKHFFYLHVPNHNTKNLCVPFKGAFEKSCNCHLGFNHLSIPIPHILQSNTFYETGLEMTPIDQAMLKILQGQKSQPSADTWAWVSVSTVDVEPTICKLLAFKKKCRGGGRAGGFGETVVGS